MTKPPTMTITFWGKRSEMGSEQEYIDFCHMMKIPVDERILDKNMFVRGDEVWVAVKRTRRAKLAPTLKNEVSEERKVRMDAERGIPFPIDPEANG